MSSELKIITVFQDYKTSVSKYRDSWDDILSFKDIIGSQNCILEANGDLRISHFIGAFSKGNTVLRVLPKIYSGHSQVEGHNEAAESLAFVFRLLGWSNFFNFKSLNSFREIRDDEDLLEIIARIFIDEFLILHRQNIYREYIEQEDDQLYIKGQILFHKSLSYNSTKNFTKRIRYDELSINNKINRILKSTLLLLLGRVNSSENKWLIRLAASYLEDVQPIVLNNDLFNSVVFNRINQDYKPLIDLACLLSNSQNPGFSAGRSRILSFTVQLNILYEYFINRVLNDIYEEPYKVMYQSGGYLAKNMSDNDVFHLKPDFRVVKSGETILIIDTKFKNPVDNNGNINVSASDIYQMCTYAIRFCCSEIVLLYPLFFGQKQRANQIYKIRHNGSDFKIRIAQVDIVKNNYDEIVGDVRMNVFEVADNGY